MQGNGGCSWLQKRVWGPLSKAGWLTKWILLALVLFLPLTFFLHFREVQMEVLEIGTKAPHYVISQADFSFLDEEATQALKQEAVRDIGMIYKVDETQILSYRHGVENALIDHQQWRRALPETTFEEIYTLLDGIQERLIQVRLAERRTLHRMEALHLETHDLFALEGSVEDGVNYPLPTPVFTELSVQLSSLPAVHKKSVEYVVDLFARHSWGLSPDFVLQHSVQQVAKDRVKDRFTPIEAGLQIIKKGEVVTARHITMLQAMQSALDQSRNLWNLTTFSASALLSLTLIIVGILYLHLFHRAFLRSFQKTTLLILILLMSLAAAKGVEHLLLSFESNLVEIIRFPLLMPFAALLVCVLIGTEIAVSASFFLLIIFGVALAVDTFPFLLMNFFASVMTILFARGLHRRKEVFAVCGKVWLSLIPSVVAFNLLDNHRFDLNLGIDLLSSALFLGVTAILVVSLLPLLEFGFDVMTDMTLMEYMDPDHELLRRLSLEAPGTYQHSLVVGHLSESAARAIGARGLFCRVATLYHDIGKLFNPHYFTENQLGGFNIHQLLTPTESTQVIISHVTEGELLARKHGLPQGFIDVIREHHGTTMVYYFYCKQVEQMGGDVTRVHEKSFRYPGPKPRSKESAIIMIADTVEAASRSLGEVTEEAVHEMIDKLVSKKAEDGQFNECQLTFEELGRVKKAMVKALIVACHLRIKYPK